MVLTVMWSWVKITIWKPKKMSEINFYGIVSTYQVVLPGMMVRKSGLIINLSTGPSGLSHSLYTNKIPQFAVLTTLPIIGNIAQQIFKS